MIVSDIIVGICLFALFTSILINFAESTKGKVQKEKKSIVETGTMILFFLFFYSLIRFRVGSLAIPNYMILTIIGLTMVTVGCVLNIIGRFNLGKNWANQIKIYKQQKLVTKGMYRFVRHPLYSSLVLMFYGASIAYLNYAAFLANTFIFIPFMYYRANQEEKLLKDRFKEYEEYSKKVGMFFPK
ncbi:isoprenylcysteine carboxylmethyltransferase family protein [Candidatus Woesearchaeota archaeon]|nr:isoprenylcysteine carboxylmethyltransferase family protein [Candidatus Woesearchaeota archaeon]